MNKDSDSFTYERQVPVVDRADVVVFGGGPAGLGAAVGAAWTGADTLLVERYGYLGGNATASLVGPFMTSYSHDGEKQIVGGVFEALVRRLEASGGAVHPSEVRAGSAYAGFRSFGHDHVTPFDPETLKLESLALVVEAGVRPLLHTSFVDVIDTGGDNRVALVFGKSGLQAIAGEVFIDCTADADVSVAAGADFEIGRKQDGLTQPMTMFFRVGNIDSDQVSKYREEHPEEGEDTFSTLVEEARASGDYDIPRNKIGIYETPTPGVWRVNTTRIQKLDGTSNLDLTKAEIEGRRQVQQLMHFFRKYMPGFEDAVLLDTAAQIGVRETRRIVGDYVLTVEDIMEARSFPDTIALNAYPIDIHSPTDDSGGATAAHEFGDPPRFHEIPYRVLIPKGLERILVAGRCISATHEALGAVRVMPPVFAMGHAAGTAAALTVSQGHSVRDVDVSMLQSELQAQGAILE